MSTVSQLQLPDKAKKLALATLLLASLVINIGFSGLSPVFPYLILALKGVLTQLPELTLQAIPAHQGAIEFGILMAAFVATRAPMALLSGTLSDHLGRKKLILTGMTLYTLVSIGFLISNDIPTFTLFRAVQGIASAMVWPVAEAYIADITTSKTRGKAISAYITTMNIAEIVGPAIGVIIYKAYIAAYGTADVIAALKSPFIFFAATSVISAIMLIKLPSLPTPKTSAETASLHLKALLKHLQQLPPETSRSIKTIYINGVMNGISMGIMHTALVLYIVEEVAKDPTALGILFLIVAAASLPITLAAGAISDHLGKRKPLITLGYILSRPTAFIIPFLKALPHILIAATFTSLAFSLAMPLMRTLQADLTPQQIRGTIFGAQQLFFNSGIVIGALLGSILTQQYAPHHYTILNITTTGYIIPFWTVATLGTITTILLILYITEKPATQQQAPTNQ